MTVAGSALVAAIVQYLQGNGALMAMLPGGVHPSQISRSPGPHATPGAFGANGHVLACIGVVDKPQVPHPQGLPWTFDAYPELHCYVDDTEAAAVAIEGIADAVRALLATATLTAKGRPVFCRAVPDRFGIRPAPDWPGWWTRERIRATGQWRNVP